jgi:hypothetical protein
MRFMLLVIPKVYENADANFVPPTDLIVKMGKFNQSMTDAGVLLSLDGLQPPINGTRIAFGGGKPRVIDGPFSESKELIGGYWIIQVRSKDEAVEWARRAPMQDGDMIEVRQIQEMSDFPPEVRAAAGLK